MTVPKLQRIDSPNGRKYVGASGIAYPSVTTVLGWEKKKHIDEWRKRVGGAEADRISAYSSHRGTQLHQVCEDYVSNKNVDYESLDNLTFQLFTSMQPHLNDIDDVRGIEIQMYSDYLGVAGSADLIARYRGKRSIVDYKTSGKFKRREWIHDYFMQTAIYAVMFEELTGIPIPQLVIIIAVEGYKEPQIFVERRDDWIGPAIGVIQRYKVAHAF